MDKMMMTRRGLVLGAGALVLAGCSNGVGSNGSGQIDARVDATQSFLFGRYPGTQDLANKAAGVLYMPLVTEAGFGIGGSYGRGALRIRGVTVDYYSAARGTIGFQIGAQQYAHALFFMTPDALEQFRRSNGWAAGPTCAMQPRNRAPASARKPPSLTRSSRWSSASRG
jgi:lipid-binding SYLF domain-containing protein